MWFFLALLFVLVYARKFWAMGYQRGNNESAYRLQSALHQVETKDDFDKMMRAYRNFYMREDK